MMQHGLIDAKYQLLRYVHILLLQPGLIEQFHRRTALLPAYRFFNSNAPLQLFLNNLYRGPLDRSSWQLLPEMGPDKKAESRTGA